VTFETVKIGPSTVVFKDKNKLSPLEFPCAVKGVTLKLHAPLTGCEEVKVSESAPSTNHPSPQPKHPNPMLYPKIGEDNVGLVHVNRISPDGSSV
jgi:hypothetical protein